MEFAFKHLLFLIQPLHHLDFLSLHIDPSQSTFHTSVTPSEAAAAIQDPTHHLSHLTSNPFLPTYDLHDADVEIVPNSLRKAKYTK